MTVLDERAASNRAALLERLAELDEQRGLANAGGGESALARHRGRGKLTVRERLDLGLGLLVGGESVQGRCQRGDGSPPAARRQAPHGR